MAIATQVEAYPCGFPLALGLKMKMNLRILPVLFLAFALPATAESPPTESGRAQPLRNCETSATRDLGVWDDVFVCADEDMIVLRRGEQLFSISMAASADPNKLVATRAAKKAQIVAAVSSGTRFWLFMHSSDGAPFAIDAYSDRLSQFDIPGLEIPGENAPSIQSQVIIRHADAALVMVAGGDRKTWPGAGNRPIYFWISLKSGEVVALPIGWDLECFLPDQKAAVFEKPQEKDFVSRPLQEIDLRTGKLTSETSDLRKKGAVPFDWTDTQTVKPLHLWRQETGSGDIAGVVVNGYAYRFNLGLDGVHYLSSAKASDGFLGFRLRREGALGIEPSAFWQMELKQGSKPQLMATGVTDFAMLDGGNCVLATAGHGPRGVSAEGFFLIHGDKTMWNILEGVDRLPELGKEFADAPYVEDKMSLRLVEGFGSGNHGKLVFCLFTHFRGDMRSLQDKALERKTWRRAIILGSAGHRYATDALREGTLPDQIWFHNSGRLIKVSYQWKPRGSSSEREVQLSETTVRLPAKPE